MVSVGGSPGARGRMLASHTNNPSMLVCSCLSTTRPMAAVPPGCPPCDFVIAIEDGCEPARFSHEVLGELDHIY